MPEKVGDVVRAARLAKGWSQRELARRIKKSPTYVTYLESGANPSAKDGQFAPGLEAIDALAAVLDLDVNELRLLAGYAPKGPTASGPPRNLEEFLRVAEQWGWIDMISLKTKKPIEEFTEEDFAEFWERMRRHFNNELDFKLRDR